MAAIWQVPGSARRFSLRGFTIHRMELQPGSLAIQLDAHLLTFAPAGVGLQGAAGQLGTVDVLPAGVRLELAASEPWWLDAIEVPTAFVRRAGDQAGVLPLLQRWADPIAFQAAGLVVATANDRDDATQRLVPVEQLMWVVVNRILQHAARPLGARIGAGQLDPERLARVRDHIAANLHQRLTLDELAAVAALNLHHFARAFMRSVGTTPAKYVLQQRVQHAQALLAENSTQPISAIAADAGFASQAHMCGVFRRQVGMSPSAYRANGTRCEIEPTQEL